MGDLVMKYGGPEWPPPSDSLKRALEKLDPAIAPIRDGRLVDRPTEVVERVMTPAVPSPAVPSPATAEQPAPDETSIHPAVWDLVRQEMLERDREGQRRYGTRLRGFNGRDALVDAFQEALDLCVYLRQAIYERDHR